MGRSPSITVGDATEGMRVEHVKSRGLVRLTRWSAGRAQDEPVGLEVSEFCSRLGITTDVLGTTRRYLLVAGSRHPEADHVVALFASEGEARADFERLRRAEPGEDAWAEVTELTLHGDARPICWFGSARSAGVTPRGHASACPPLFRGLWRRLRWQRA